MKPKRTGLLVAAGALTALCIASSCTSSEGWLTAWFLLMIFCAFPVLRLTWVEFWRALRNIPSPSRTRFFFGIFFGLPQAMFGLRSVIRGIAVIGWALYNSFISRQYEYTGGFPALGIGPALTLFGVVWLHEGFTWQRASDARHGVQAGGPAV